MNIEIKIAKLKDLRACVSALENSTLSTAYFQSETSRINAVREAIDSGNTYAAFYNGECVRFAYYIEGGAFHAFPYIHLISIKECYRENGIGRMLIKYVERKLFEISDKIFLVVGDYNSDGKRFYEKLGYMFIGTIPDLYRQGIAENIMMKKYNML